MNLVHVSPHYFPDQPLYKCRFSHYLVQAGLEEGETERACAALSVTGALRARRWNHNLLHVYLIDEFNSIVSNDEIVKYGLVVDAEFTQEVWIVDGAATARYIFSVSISEPSWDILELNNRDFPTYSIPFYLWCGYESIDRYKIQSNQKWLFDCLQ